MPKLGRRQRAALNVFATMLAIYVGVAFVGAWIVGNQRDGCGNVNVLRSSQYDFLRSAEAARQADYEKTGSKTDLTASKQYGHLADKMVVAAGDDAAKPGRPELNCGEAYPRPLPWPS
jgi:hypothetical protein